MDFDFQQSDFWRTDQTFDEVITRPFWRCAIWRSDPVSISSWSTHKTNPDTKYKIWNLSKKKSTFYFLHFFLHFEFVKTGNLNPNKILHFLKRKAKMHLEINKISIRRKKIAFNLHFWFRTMMYQHWPWWLNFHQFF